MSTSNKGLNQAIVDSAKYEGKNNGRFILWDGDGFGLRVYPSGRKVFVLSYRYHGRKRLLKLGEPNEDFTVKQARTKARSHMNEISDDIDPLFEKKKRNQAASFEELSKTYIEEHAKTKKSGRNDISMIENILNPKIGTIPLRDITREDLAPIHRQIGKQINERTGKPKIYQANRVLALLSKMFEFAVTEGFLPESHPNPAKRIKKFREESRDTWVKPEQLPALAQAIDQEKNTIARDGLWLYLLTGLRKSELLTLKWSDIDFQRGEIRLEDTKSGRRHYVPASEAAKAKLESMPRLDGNPYVLPGAIEGNHLVNIDKPWQRVRKAAGLEHVRLHDLRRTVGSWLASSGNSLHLIGRVLNHTNPSTTQIYARFGDDPVRQALDAHGKQILGAAGKARNEVLELKNVKTS